MCKTGKKQVNEDDTTNVRAKFNTSAWDLQPLSLAYNLPKKKQKKNKGGGLFLCFYCVGPLHFEYEQKRHETLMV